MDGPASVPLPTGVCDESDHISNEGTHYVEYSIDAVQHRITCRINEEGRDEMDLEFMCQCLGG
jgi:hypothetical protein